MGMFDTIYCLQPLPDGLTAEDFQSKSLHNTLSVYEIGADRRLRELAIDRNGNVLSEDARDTGYHGVLRFHTLVGTELRGYEAKFSDGMLVGLRTEDDALYDERGLRLIKEDPK
jgi:hypothetical protein